MTTADNKTETEEKEPTILQMWRSLLQELAKYPAIIEETKNNLSHMQDLKKQTEEMLAGLPEDGTDQQKAARYAALVSIAQADAIIRTDELMLERMTKVSFGIKPEDAEVQLAELDKFEAVVEDLITASSEIPLSKRSIAQVISNVARVIPQTSGLSFMRLAILQEIADKIVATLQPKSTDDKS